MNNGEVAGGPGNQLIMMIPDSARLNVTAQTADTDINSLALTIGGSLAANGIIEVVGAITAAGTSLTVTNAVAPPGGQNGPVCYILTSTGSYKATVEAGSGTAYKIADGGAVEGFEAISGKTYCVKYFVANSSVKALTIPALFAPKVVRAHFAVNLYAKKSGSDAMESSVVGIRHYYFPYYFFTAALNETASQTETGTVDLSGTCLTYEEAVTSGNCASYGAQSYGFIVDEILGTHSSTSKVDGIYFIGLGSGASVEIGDSLTLPIKYSIDGMLTNISDMSEVTLTSSDTEKATMEGNVITGVAEGTVTVTASVTNSSTSTTYTDVVSVAVVQGD